jgi:hypothetical protein
MRIVLVGMLVASLTGCSFLVSRPPGRPRPGDGPCSVSYVPALIDTWEAASAGVGALWALGKAKGSDADTMAAIAGITAAVGAGFAASAAYGFGNVRRCREQNQERRSVHRRIWRP